MATTSETSAAVPPLFRRHTHRPRLTRLLDESTAQAIVLTAPAGYGKTTLVAEWLQNRDDAVWYRSTSASADVAAFSAGIAEIAAPLCPGAGELLRQRLRVAEAPERAVRPLAELLAEDFAHWPEGALLVIDDYHLVADSTPVEEFVDWLLTLAPVRIVATTRRRPSWASARRTLYGEITEIGRDQLAMTTEEATRILGDRPPESVRAIVAQAEGWPALLGLAALSAASELPQERVSEALFRYFAEEVLRQEPSEVQDFMFRAAVPPSITAASAAETLEIPGTTDLITRLHEQGVLAGDIQGDLRFHPLLRDFLHRKLKLEDPALWAILLRRSIEFARSVASWDDAFTLAIEGGDSETACDVITQAAPALLAEGRTETLMKWVSECGYVAVQRPGSNLVRAELLTLQGRLSEATALARDVASRLGVEHPEASRAWYVAGRAAHLVCAEQEALECHLNARQAAVTETDLKNALWGALLAGMELELPETDKYLDHLTNLANDLDTRLRVPVGKALLRARQGSLRGVWREFEPLLSAARQCSDPMVRSTFLAHAACVSSARGDYPLGESLAFEATHYCEDLRLHFALGVCLAHRASAEIGLRKFTHAKATLEKLRRLGAEHEDPWLFVVQAIADLKLRLAMGDLSHLRRTEDFVLPNDAPRGVQGEYLGLLALALATTHRTEQARELAQSARDLTNGVEALYFSGFADSIAELLAEEPGAEEKTIALVFDAEKDEFLESFVLAYRAFPSLLELMARGTETVFLAQRATRLANDQALYRISNLPPSLEGEVAIGVLTPRELEVLGLMAKGFTNAEIADQLVIASSTAKVHVHNILKKLGVKTRLQAALSTRNLID